MKIICIFLKCFFFQWNERLKIFHNLKFSLIIVSHYRYKKDFFVENDRFYFFKHTATSMARKSQFGRDWLAFSTLEAKFCSAVLVSLFISKSLVLECVLTRHTPGRLTFPISSCLVLY